MSATPGLSAWILRSARISPAAAVHLAVRCTGFTGFARLERAVPRSGAILDLGCGHGLLALLAASREPAREVLGIDLLEERLDVARRVAARHGLRNVCFERRSILDLPEGPFAAVVVADVLFYLPREAQRQVLERAASRLAPGGRLVVKEQVRAPAWKAWMVETQERLAYALRVGFGLFRGWGEVVTPDVHLWGSAELAALLRSFDLEVRDERLDRFSYLSHHLFVGTFCSSLSPPVAASTAFPAEKQNVPPTSALPGR